MDSKPLKKLGWAEIWFVWAFHSERLHWIWLFIWYLGFSVKYVSEVETRINVFWHRNICSTFCLILLCQLFIPLSFASVSTCGGRTWSRDSACPTRVHDWEHSAAVDVAQKISVPLDVLWLGSHCSEAPVTLCLDGVWCDDELNLMCSPVAKWSEILLGQDSFHRTLNVCLAVTWILSDKLLPLYWLAQTGSLSHSSVIFFLPF